MYKLIMDGKGVTLSNYEASGSMDCNNSGNRKITALSLLPSIQNPIWSLPTEPILAIQHSNTDELLLIRPALEENTTPLDTPQQCSKPQGTGGMSLCTKRNHVGSLRPNSSFQIPSIDPENLAITNVMRNKNDDKDFRNMIQPCLPMSVGYDKSDGSLHRSTKQELDYSNTFGPLVQINKSTTHVQQALSNTDVPDDLDIGNSQKFGGDEQMKSLEGEVLNLDYDFSCEDREERPLKRRSTCLWMIIDENDSSQNNLQTRIDLPAVIENFRKNHDQTATAMERINMHSACYAVESNGNSGGTNIRLPHGIVDMETEATSHRNNDCQEKCTIDHPVGDTLGAVAKESINNAATAALITNSDPPQKKNDPREADSFQRVLASYDEPLLPDDKAQPVDRKKFETVRIDPSPFHVEQQNESGSVEVLSNEHTTELGHDDNNDRYADGHADDDEDDNEDDNVNVAEPSGGPPPKSRDTDEMFSQFTELDKLQFDKVYSKRKMELEMQAETRARTISARWAKEGLSLQTIIDTALKDYIELYENAHALRLQFEAEKEIWKKSAMESMHKDPDGGGDRYQKQKTCATCNQFGGQSMYPSQSREWGSTDDGHWGHSQAAGGNKGNAYGDSFWGGNEKLLYAAEEESSTKDMDEELNSMAYPPRKGATTSAPGDADAVHSYGGGKSSHYGYKGKHDRQFDPQVAGLTIQKPFQPSKSKSAPPKTGKQ